MSSTFFFRFGKFLVPQCKTYEMRDINTGLAYRETWKRMVGDKPQTDSGRWIVPDPLIFYMDSCTTGAFMNLSLELVKFTSGLLNRDARNKDYARIWGLHTQIWQLQTLQSACLFLHSRRMTSCNLPCCNNKSIIWCCASL